MFELIRNYNYKFVHSASLLLTASLLILSACGTHDSASSENSLQGNVAVQLPDELANRISDQTNGTLSATISIDGGAAQAMTISGTSATATLGSIPTGSHTFTIVFTFDHNLYAPLTVASAEKDFTVVAGSNTLSFDQTEYDLSFDEDGDGVPNIIELDPASNTSPIVALCQLGTAVLGSCELGS